MKILITAFNPFAGAKINPSQIIVESLSEESFPFQLEGLVLPTEFEASKAKLKDHLTKNHYDKILNLGQAGGRQGITLERVAINIQDASIPDNAGLAPIDKKIRIDGPAAYFSTIPIKAIVQAIRNQGIKASVSNTAGTYVCNTVMYTVLDYINLYKLNTQAGFMHIPYLPSQVEADTNTAFMSLDEMLDAVRIALLVMANDRGDILLADGKTH